jgi:hypothetical protein
MVERWTRSRALLVTPVITIIITGAALLCGGCTSRATRAQDGGPTDAQSPSVEIGPIEIGPIEIGLVDQGPISDRSLPRDQALADSVASPDASGFCAGPPRAVINGRELSLAAINASTEILGSCCGPGERIVFAAQSGERLSVAIARFSNIPVNPAPLDLTALPTGWVVGLRCEPYQDCAVLTSHNAVLSGTLVYQILQAPPRYVLDICVTAKPKADGSSPAGFSGLRLHSKAVTVHRACVVGMDQSCNEDPAVSALRGTCEKDSTCTCAVGQPNAATGKCP